MPKREPKRASFKWTAFNHAYGPWYHLTQMDGSTVSGGEALVAPDMNRGRWFWYVRIGKKDAPRAQRNGHELTKEEAQKAAREVFDLLY